MFPPEYSDALRQLTRLRGALVPYLYTLARRTQATAWPFIRPMWWDNPGPNAEPKPNLNLNPNGNSNPNRNPNPDRDANPNPNPNPSPNPNPNPNPNPDPDPNPNPKPKPNLRAEQDGHVPARLVLPRRVGGGARLRANAELAPAVGLRREQELLEGEREQPTRLRHTEGERGQRRRVGAAGQVAPG